MQTLIPQSASAKAQSTGRTFAWAGVALPRVIAVWLAVGLLLAAPTIIHAVRLLFGTHSGSWQWQLLVAMLVWDAVLLLLAVRGFTPLALYLLCGGFLLAGPAFCDAKFSGLTRTWAANADRAFGDAAVGRAARCADGRRSSSVDGGDAVDAAGAGVSA
jgi:hypothetical protein